MDHQTAATYMRAALDQAAQAPEGTARVGAVAVSASGDVVTGHKSEGSPGKHAEVALLEKAAEAGIDLRGATVFVTLEPCANLEGARMSCADQLIKAGVAVVYIGSYDNNFRINRHGWRRLTEAGVQCRDFTAEFRNQANELNQVFREFFIQRTGALTGTARFDWTTNGGRYVLSASDEPGAASWTTQWTTRGANSIYAYGGHPGTVALARYATDFSQIDDPDAYDFESTSASLGVGDIAIYRNAHGYALVQVLEVEAPPPYGTTEHVALKFAYELRPNP